MRVAAVTLATLALASTAAASQPSSGAVSGLRGLVMRGPTKPICAESDPCEAPAVGVYLRFARSGSMVAQARTNAAGAYRLLLRPGTYTVTTPRRVGSGLTPRVVRVPAGRVARVDFHLDTGIQ